MSRDTDIIYIKQRKVRHWAALLIVLLIFAIGMQIRIKNVTVLGNETYTAEQAEELIFSDYWHRNTFIFFLISMKGKK